jgi:hypothetical protein
MTFVLEVPDQYDEVYSNMPTDTHMLKPIANCKHCDAKRFEALTTWVLLSRRKD